MNLNAIYKTWALVNKNTKFSNTRKFDFIEAFKLVKLLLKCFNFVVLENVKNENETDAASAAYTYFQNIKYQVEEKVWSINIFLRNEICIGFLYGGFLIFWQGRY